MRQLLFLAFTFFLIPAFAVESTEFIAVVTDTVKKPDAFCVQNPNGTWGEIRVHMPTPKGLVFVPTGTFNPDPIGFGGLLPLQGYVDLEITHPVVLRGGSRERIHLICRFYSSVQITEQLEVMEAGGFHLLALASQPELYPFYAGSALFLGSCYAINWKTEPYFAQMLQNSIDAISMEDVVSVFGSAAVMLSVREKVGAATEEAAREIFYDDIQNLISEEDFNQNFHQGGEPDWEAILSGITLLLSKDYIEGKVKQRLEEWREFLEQKIKEEKKKGEWRINTPESLGSIHKYYKGNFSPTENDIANASVYPSGDHIQILIHSGPNKGNKTIGSNTTENVAFAMKLTELLVDSSKMSESELCAFYKQNVEYFDYIWPGELLSGYNVPYLDKLHAAASVSERKELIKEFLDILSSQDVGRALFGPIGDQTFSFPGYRSYKVSPKIELASLSSGIKIGQMNCVRRDPEDDQQEPFYQLHFKPTPAQLRYLLKDATNWSRDSGDSEYVSTKVEYMGRLLLPDSMNRYLWSYPRFSQKENTVPVEFLDVSAVYFGDVKEEKEKSIARVERKYPEKRSEKMEINQGDIFKHLVTSTGPVRVEPVEIEFGTLQELVPKLEILNRNEELYVIEAAESRYGLAIWRKLYHIRVRN